MKTTKHIAVIRIKANELEERSGKYVPKELRLIAKKLEKGTELKEEDKELLTHYGLNYCPECGSSEYLFEISPTQEGCAKCNNTIIKTK